jgi:hypothetical protein
VSDPRRGADLVDDEWSDDEWPHDPATGIEPDALARAYFLGAMTIIALLVGAYQVGEHWPDTWASTIAGAVPAVILLALVPWLLIGLLHPFWLIARGVVRLLRALVGRPEEPVGAASPFVPSRVDHARVRVRSVLAESLGWRLLVAGGALLGVHLLIAGAQAIVHAVLD